MFFFLSYPQLRFGLGRIELRVGGVELRVEGVELRVRMSGRGRLGQYPFRRRFEGNVAIHREQAVAHVGNAV